MAKQIVNIGDCRMLIKDIPDKSVDFCFTDPPYNVCKDYGIYKDNLSISEYYNMMKLIIRECRRVSKKGIAFYVGGNLTKTFYDLIPDAHLIIVHKKAVGITDKKYFLQYHSLFVTAPPINKCKDLWDDIRLPGEGYFFREKRYDSAGLTSLELTKKILGVFTNENDTILDPFVGTGTTLQACRDMNRNGIGFEIDQKYYSLINSRIITVPQIKKLNNVQEI